MITNLTYIKKAEEFADNTNNFVERFLDSRIFKGAIFLILIFAVFYFGQAILIIINR